MGYVVIVGKLPQCMIFKYFVFVGCIWGVKSVVKYLFIGAPNSLVNVMLVFYMGFDNVYKNAYNSFQWSYLEFLKIGLQSLISLLSNALLT